MSYNKKSMGKTATIIGREKEIAEFEKYVRSAKPEFIAMSFNFFQYYSAEVNAAIKARMGEE